MQSDEVDPQSSEDCSRRPDPIESDQAEHDDADPTIWHTPAAANIGPAISMDVLSEPAAANIGPAISMDVLSEFSEMADDPSNKGTRWEPTVEVDDDESRKGSSFGESQTSRTDLADDSPDHDWGRRCGGDNRVVENIVNEHDWAKRCFTSMHRQKTEETGSLAGQPDRRSSWNRPRKQDSEGRRQISGLPSGSGHFSDAGSDTYNRSRGGGQNRFGTYSWDDMERWGRLHSISKARVADDGELDPERTPQEQGDAAAESSAFEGAWDIFDRVRFDSMSFCSSTFSTDHLEPSSGVENILGSSPKSSTDGDKGQNPAEGSRVEPDPQTQVYTRTSSEDWVAVTAQAGSKDVEQTGTEGESPTVSAMLLQVRAAALALSNESKPGMRLASRRTHKRTSRSESADDRESARRRQTRSSRSLSADNRITSHCVGTSSEKTPHPQRRSKLGVGSREQSPAWVPKAHEESPSTRRRRQQQENHRRGSRESSPSSGLRPRHYQRQGGSPDQRQGKADAREEHRRRNDELIRSGNSMQTVDQPFALPKHNSSTRGTSSQFLGKERANSEVQVAESERLALQTSDRTQVQISERFSSKTSSNLTANSEYGKTSMKSTRGRVHSHRGPPYDIHAHRSSAKGPKKKIVSSCVSSSSSISTTTRMGAEDSKISESFRSVTTRASMWSNGSEEEPAIPPKRWAIIIIILSNLVGIMSMLVGAGMNTPERVRMKSIWSVSKYIERFDSQYFRATDISSTFQLNFRCCCHEISQACVIIGDSGVCESGKRLASIVPHCTKVIQNIYKEVIRPEIIEKKFWINDPFAFYGIVPKMIFANNAVMDKPLLVVDESSDSMQCLSNWFTGMDQPPITSDFLTISATHLDNTPVERINGKSFEEVADIATRLLKWTEGKIPNVPRRVVIHDWQGCVIFCAEIRVQMFWGRLVMLTGHRINTMGTRMWKAKRDIWFWATDKENVTSCSVERRGCDFIPVIEHNMNAIKNVSKKVVAEVGAPWLRVDFIFTPESLKVFKVHHVDPTELPYMQRDVHEQLLVNFGRPEAYSQTEANKNEKYSVRHLPSLTC